MFAFITDIVDRLRGRHTYFKLPAEFDLDARKAQAARQAREDAASGAFDVIALEALETLPYERRIDADVRMLQERATGHRPTSTGAETGDSTLLTQTRETQQANLAADAEKRDHVSQVLRGAKAGEVDWSGFDPAAPTSSRFWGIVLRPAVVAALLISIGAVAVLYTAEAYVMMRNVRLFIAGETQLFSLVLAIVLALIMTAPPHAIGVATVTSRRRGHMLSREKVTLAVLIPFWLVVGVIIGFLRTFAAQRHAVLDAAEDLEIPIDQVDPSQVFNFWLNFGLWTAIALGIGFALFAIKLFTYNPYRAQALKLDTSMALRSRRIGKLNARLDAEARARKAHEDQRSSDAEAYQRMYLHALPAAGDVVKAHYRATLVRLVGNPDFTTGLTTVSAETR